jgi:ABC-type transporter Mla maintaining outer membrane lipid asymmetry ATPase subunit MlaF
MDVIALRKTSGVIEGEVRLNGFLQERVSFLRSSGYVEQFDVQQAELTVKETVEFSAQLRLLRNNPITATNKGRLQFVDYVLELMELTSIAELQVGSYEEGGLTFEQRKRLAIAVELAASPSILFLDEPTSGDKIYCLCSFSFAEMFVVLPSAVSYFYCWINRSRFSRCINSYASTKENCINGKSCMCDDSPTFTGCL